MNIFTYLILGFSSITLLDVLGSIASRKFSFKYQFLAFLSCALYIAFGFLVSKHFGFWQALLVNGLMGLFDGTIGFYLSIVLKANTGFDKEKSMERLNGKTARFMIWLACLMAAIGGALAKI